jgi:hypothetical protein
VKRDYNLNCLIDIIQVSVDGAATELTELNLTAATASLKKKPQFKTPNKPKHNERPMGHIANLTTHGWSI